MSDAIKPLLYTLADAIEVDLIPTGSYTFEGSRKAVLDLFEGYSPTVVSTVQQSLVDHVHQVVAAQLQVFGNLGVIVVVEGIQAHVSAFVYDRSKTPENTNCKPWDTHWSRRNLHYWLEKSCKAIYQRSMFDTVWEQLPEPKNRLRAYNESRDRGALSAKDAYNAFWGLTNATESV